MRPARVRAWLRGTSTGGRIGLVLFAAIVLLCAFGPFLLSDPNAQDLAAYQLAPGSRHLLGTDGDGRDLLARVLAGGRPSLVISALGMLCSVSLGLVLGMLAAFGGRLAERTTGFLMDVQLALPYVLVAIVLVSVFGGSVPLLIVMMALAGWVQVARVVRAIALSERSKDYVLAAQVVGASQRRIAKRYVLPTVLPAVLALAPLQMAAMLVIEATLSFLGMGIKPPAPSWGSIMLEGKDYLDTAWWLTFFPGLAIFLTALSLLLISDGVQRDGGEIDRLEALAVDDAAESPLAGGALEVTQR
jgi:peptide/nickel transport system permease protein